MKVKKYVKKPVEIEAILYTGTNFNEVQAFCTKHIIECSNGIEIPTLEGTIKASPGDYIIRGICGEYYPCKPDIFMKTYEEVI